MIVACDGIIIAARNSVKIAARPLKSILAKPYAASDDTINYPPVPSTTMKSVLKNTLGRYTCSSVQTVT